MKKRTDGCQNLFFFFGLKDDVFTGNEKINKDIIGGVQLKYGDTLIDNSISSRIGSIAKELKDND